jgi:hypothetical protein
MTMARNSADRLGKLPRGEAIGVCRATQADPRRTIAAERVFVMVRTPVPCITPACPQCCCRERMDRTNAHRRADRIAGNRAIVAAALNGMAMAKGSTQASGRSGSRSSASRRVQVKNPIIDRWVKVDTHTGRIVDTKKSPGPYKGIPKKR